jgi:hypothetical protein
MSKKDEKIAQLEQDVKNLTVSVVALRRQVDNWKANATEWRRIADADRVLRERYREALKKAIRTSMKMREHIMDAHVLSDEIKGMLDV